VWAGSGKEENIIFLAISSLGSYDGMGNLVEA
jgi:hypothetical protein